MKNLRRHSLKHVSRVTISPLVTQQEGGQHLPHLPWEMADFPVRSAPAPTSPPRSAGSRFVCAPCRAGVLLQGKREEGNASHVYPSKRRENRSPRKCSLVSSTTYRGRSVSHVYCCWSVSGDH